MAILTTQSKAAAGDNGADRREQGRRRAYEKLAAKPATGRNRPLCELARQRRAIVAQAVHFPIACDQRIPNPHVAALLPGHYHPPPTITPAFRRVNRPGPSNRGHLPPCSRRSPRKRDPSSPSC